MTGLALHRVSVRDAAGRPILHDVTLHAAPGQAMVVIGETGSGKSLLAQALLGLLPPGFAASGTMDLTGSSEIRLDDPAALRRLWARSTLLLPQEPRAALDPTMRVGRQLAHAAALAAVDLAPRLARAYPFALSGGEAQRVLVATALLAAAPVIVVDEPTKGLDSARAAQVTALLRTLLEQGRTMLVITHDPALARGLGGSVAVLHRGTAVECRPADELFADPGHPYTSEWLAADPTAWPASPSAAGPELVLQARSLSFARRARAPLFEHVSLQVPSGGILGITGPSGAGKTTLGNILVGLQRPDSGQVTWQGGTDPYRDPSARHRLRRRYQKLHQDPAASFIPHRPIGRQLADLVEVVPDLALATALPILLDQLGLRRALLDRLPAELSSGEAQRLALIRLLLLDPILIVADEPTSRLDPIRQRETIQLLRRTLRSRSIGLVLITHDQALLAATADTTLLLPQTENEGRPGARTEPRRPAAPPRSAACSPAIADIPPRS